MFSLTQYHDWTTFTSFLIDHPSFDCSSSSDLKSWVLSRWLTKKVSSLCVIGNQINFYKPFPYNILPQTHAKFSGTWSSMADSWFLSKHPTFWFFLLVAVYFPSTRGDNFLLVVLVSRIFNWVWFLYTSDFFQLTDNCSLVFEGGKRHCNIRIWSLWL